jgi:hypothetical protein
MSWRNRITIAILCCNSALGIATNTGCQSWSGMGAPMQASTRVPPPATGSYNLQGAYYNNPATATSSTSTPASTTAPVVQASATSNPYAPAGANFPTSQYVGDTSANYASAANQPSNSSASVSTAGYTDNPNSGAQVIPASSLQTGDFSQLPTPPTDATNLQWQ